MKPWQGQEWCVANLTHEYVWRMEDLLDLYAERADPRRPVVCVDEVSYQLLADVRPPIPAAPGRPRRRDYEYRRAGTCNLFVAVEPLAGRRQVSVTERRCAVDFAHFLKELLDVHYPDAEVIRLVTDNLNTHRPAALYEAFDPATARRLTKRIEWHYTPVHASWLNMAEIEIGVLKVQCLKRRLPDIGRVVREVAAWQKARNAERATIRWMFSTDSAREKMDYPKKS